MQLCRVLLLTLVSGTSAAAELCADRHRSIESDMQIQESDLNASRALEAAIWLEQHLEDVSDDQVMELGRRNRLKVLRGYALRQKALDEREASENASAGSITSAEAFCAWLAKDGFWYD